MNRKVTFSTVAGFLSVCFRLPLSDRHAERERLFRASIKSQTTNYGRYNGRRYRYAYLAVTDYGALPTAVVKIDFSGPTTYQWSEPGLHPGEPIFVPTPALVTEDNGVVLSLAFDGRAEQSVLLCLDAATLTERARAPLPHRLPYGFYGQFSGTTDPGRSMA